MVAYSSTRRTSTASLARQTTRTLGNRVTLERATYVDERYKLQNSMKVRPKYANQV